MAAQWTKDGLLLSGEKKGMTSNKKRHHLLAIEAAWTIFANMFSEVALFLVRKLCVSMFKNYHGFIRKEPYWPQSSPFSLLVDYWMGNSVGCTLCGDVIWLWKLEWPSIVKLGSPKLNPAWLRIHPLPTSFWNHEGNGPIEPALPNQINITTSL